MRSAYGKSDCRHKGGVNLEEKGHISKKRIGKYRLPIMDFVGGLVVVVELHKNQPGNLCAFNA